MFTLTYKQVGFVLYIVILHCHLLSFKKDLKHTGKHLFINFKLIKDDVRMMCEHSSNICSISSETRNALIQQEFD